MPAIDAVVFDLGGVLLDWNPRHLYRKLFEDPAEMERFLATVCTDDWNFGQDAGRPVHEATADLIDRHPRHADLIAAYYGRWLEMISGPLPGVPEIVRALADDGRPLHILSNCARETMPMARAAFRLLDRFQEFVVSGEEGVVKPDRRIYDILVARVGRPAERLVFIDDRPENVDGARAAGLSALPFTDAAALRRDLAALGLLDP